MSFRRATIEDAALLYRWRLEREHGSWYKWPATSYNDHLVWLAARLDNPLVEILIWGDDEGMVRIDSNGELAFYAVDDETALVMLRAAMQRGERLKAAVDETDPSWELLRWAGFDEHPARFLVWKPT